MSRIKEWTSPPILQTLKALQGCSGEQWLRGTGVSERRDTHVQGQRNHSKTVGAGRGHQRAGRLKPQSHKSNQSNHMDHSLV